MTLTLDRRLPDLCPKCGHHWHNHGAFTCWFDCGCGMTTCPDCEQWWEPGPPAEKRTCPHCATRDPNAAQSEPNPPHATEGQPARDFMKPSAALDLDALRRLAAAWAAAPDDTPEDFDPMKCVETLCDAVPALLASLRAAEERASALEEEIRRLQKPSSPGSVASGGLGVGCDGNRARGQR